MKRIMLAALLALLLPSVGGGQVSMYPPRLCDQSPLWANATGGDIYPPCLSSGVESLSPDSVPDLAFWVKSDTEVFANSDGTGSVVDGGTVGFLGDSIGGFDLTQATEGSRPTLALNSGFNSKPAIVFDGTGRALFNAAFNLVNNKTAATWFVAMVTSDLYDYSVVGTSNLLLGLTFSGGDPYASHHSGAYEFRTLLTGYRADKGALALYGFNAAGATDDDRIFIRWNAERYPRARSGVAISTTAFSETAGMWVGRGSAGAAPYGKFKLFELAFWPRLLTAGEIAGLEAYAKARYYANTQWRVEAVGDSLTEGYPITLGADSWPSKLDALYDSNLTVYNAGVRAYTIAQLESVGASRSDSQNDWFPRNIFIHQGGTNDMDPLGANRTAAQAIVDMTTSVTNRKAKGWTVLVCTVPPRGDLSGGDATTFESRRLAYNAAVRNGDTGAHGVIDWAADSRLQDPNNATYYYDGDKVHFTAAGNDVLATLAKAAIDTIPTK